MAKVPRIIKVPAGEAYVSTENPLGEMGYYIVSKGDLAPFRVKIRSASFNNVSITPWLLRGVYVPDIITILAASTSSSGTSIDDASPRACLLAGDDRPARSCGAGRAPRPDRRRRLPLPVQVRLFMQSRLGPMEAGPYGSLQLMAEVGKWLQKEDIFTERADRFVFAASPFVVIVSTFLLFVVIPVGPATRSPTCPTASSTRWRCRRISVIGILMAGWASANKYALLGGLRAAGQLDRLRAADDPGGGRRRHPGRHPQPAGHRPRPEPTARSSASASSATRTSSRSSSGS